MINLLPRENKIEIKREYMGRVSIMFGSFVFFALIILAMFLLSMFFIVNAQQKASNDSVETIKKQLDMQNEKEITELVSQINKKLTQLDNNKKNIGSASAIFKDIIEIKTPEIIIDSFKYKTDLTNGEITIEIHGESKTRNDFTAFIERLKKVPEFSGVESPLSSLLKEENISFSLSIKLKQS